MKRTQLQINRSNAVALAFVLILANGLLMGCKNTDINPFTLSSSEVTTALTQAQYANAFGGCTGENKSPALNWQNAPDGTQSYAITVFDRDANAGTGFNHWLLIDIPATTTSLSQDAGNFSNAKLPTGSIQTLTDAMLAGYVGVCPPVGETHNYVITVYAIGKPSLGLTAKANPATVKAALLANSLATVSLIATANH